MNSDLHGFYTGILEEEETPDMEETSDSEDE